MSQPSVGFVGGGLVASSAWGARRRHRRWPMVNGAAETMRLSGLPAPAVMDLIPVKPLAALEEHVRENYRRTLTGLYRKLTT